MFFFSPACTHRYLFQFGKDFCYSSESFGSFTQKVQLSNSIQYCPVKAENYCQMNVARLLTFQKPFLVLMKWPFKRITSCMWLSQEKNFIIQNKKHRRDIYNVHKLSAKGSANNGQGRMELHISGISWYLKRLKLHHHYLMHQYHLNKIAHT